MKQLFTRNTDDFFFISLTAKVDYMAYPTVQTRLIRFFALLRFKTFKPFMSLKCKPQALQAKNKYRKCIFFYFQPMPANFGFMAYQPSFDLFKIDASDHGD